MSIKTQLMLPVIAVTMPLPQLLSDSPMQHAIVSSSGSNQGHQLKDDPMTNKMPASKPLDDYPLPKFGTIDRYRIASGEVKPEEVHPQTITYDRFNELRKQVQDSVRMHKVFMINGAFRGMRAALGMRGWTEKFESPKPMRHLSSDSCYEALIANLPHRKAGESLRGYNYRCEKIIISKLLKPHCVDFYWGYRRERNDGFFPNMIRNRFPRVPFTSKMGLCAALQDLHWYHEEGVSHTRFPRCYNIWSSDELDAFIDDFRLTACISVLKWLVHTMLKRGDVGIHGPDGKVPYSIVHFSIKRCDEYIAFRTNSDIDCSFSYPVLPSEWNDFLAHQNRLVNQPCRFCDDESEKPQVLHAVAKQTLKSIMKYWPQMDIDGMQNIWLIKPANKSRGQGIILINHLDQVMNVANHIQNSAKPKYVIQKYIERPHIIYQTKFDIRQWFIVSSVQPLVIWMYRECYLRFSSQNFNLANFHESVHLTNNSVQKKYKNAQQRNSSLPRNNMWDSATFRTYLHNIGKDTAWTKKIYPDMKQSIIGALLASQDDMEKRANTFELFGADFMLAEDLTPWLIEVNSSPDMNPTTSVTARMCPQCLQDVVKVIVDRRDDPRADTGLFECIYDQKIPRVPPYLGFPLQVRGKGYLSSEKSNPIMTFMPSVNFSITTSKMAPKYLTTQVPPVRIFESRAVKHPREYQGPVVSDLIEFLNKEYDNKFKMNKEALSKEQSAYEPIVYKKFRRKVEKKLNQ